MKPFIYYPSCKKCTLSDKCAIIISKDAHVSLIFDDVDRLGLYPNLSYAFRIKALK